MVAVRELVVGAVAETDLMTPEGGVIVQQNDPVEEHHLVALKDSKIDYLISRPAADIADRGPIRCALGRPPSPRWS